MSPVPVRLRNRCSPLPLLLLLLGPPLQGADPATSAIAPAKNFVWPIFTKEGFHATTLSGDEVHPVGSDRIDVTNIDIVKFSGDAAAQPITILVSPQASYFPKQNRASGPTNVRLLLLRDNTEITGEDWTYEQAGEKISIRRHVRVVFQEKINSMLK